MLCALLQTGSKHCQSGGTVVAAHRPICWQNQNLYTHRSRRRTGKILILNLCNNECRRRKQAVRRPSEWFVSRWLRQNAHGKKTKEESRNDINIYYTKNYIFFVLSIFHVKEEIRKVICKTPHCTYYSTKVNERWTVCLPSVGRSFRLWVSSCNFLASSVQ